MSHISMVIAFAIFAVVTVWKKRKYCIKHISELWTSGELMRVRYTFWCRRLIAMQDIQYFVYHESTWMMFNSMKHVIKWRLTEKVKYEVVKSKSWITVINFPKQEENGFKSVEPKYFRRSYDFTRTQINNKSNSVAGAVRVEANLPGHPLPAQFFYIKCITRKLMLKMKLNVTEYSIRNGTFNWKYEPL